LSGRPILGGFAGFFLGLFVWVDLILFGVWPLESSLGCVLLILGIALGIGVAKWAPFGGRRAGSSDAVSDETEPAESERSPTVTAPLSVSTTQCWGGDVEADRAAGMNPESEWLYSVSPNGGSI
jgi:hypothetical protein